MFIFFGAVVRRATESRHLDDILSKHHMHDLKASADDKGTPELPLHLFRCGIGGDIEIFRLDPQQQIAARHRQQ